MVEEMLAQLASSVWALPVLFLLVLGDALLVIIPGETAVTAFAALSVAQGQPSLVGVVAVAATAALSGDVICYLIGRRTGLDRWAWMRRPRVVAAFGWARTRLDRSTAAVLFSARFIPFGRLAVNLTAGASRVPAPRYVLFAAGAAVVWALYQAFIGAVVARLLPGSPLLAVVVSIVVALVAGLLLDAVLARRWRRPRPPAERDVLRD
ncbi:MAG: VTT domain-containing protein [Microbacterium pygmaeum]